MKQYILILIGILCLQSCVVTKSIKYGNASVDDYSVFEQDTVARGLRTFEFADAQQKSPLIDTLKFLQSQYASRFDTSRDNGLYRCTICCNYHSERHYPF